MNDENVHEPGDDPAGQDPQFAAEDAGTAPAGGATSGLRAPARRWKLLLGVAVLAMALITVGIAALLVNISDRQDEAREPYFRVTELTEETTSAEVWGQNFPLQFESYKRTLEMDEGRPGGSEGLPAVLDEDDPRAKTTTDQKLELDPRLVDMWKGYAFSIDYREKRGHAYMLHDQAVTERVKVVDQPGACINCHASTWVVMNELGDGDQKAGFDKVNAMSYDDAAELFDHPITCIDCHDPDTMELRITKPAFEKGIAEAKAAEGIKDYDVNRDATASEMRSFVCGQCHVEYYFAGDEKTLTFPWANGLNIDDEYAYYDEVGFSDWTHKETGGDMVKAQHPEFEMWNQGVHAAAGVGCADCHMPYQREGAMKVSEHNVRSPLENINGSCQTCHSTSEDELKERVDTIQERHLRTRDTAQDALTELIADLKAAKDGGATDAELEEAWEYQRKSSFYIDWVVSENSLGFHAPGEALRILNDATDAARKGKLVLRDS